MGKIFLAGVIIGIIIGAWVQQIRIRWIRKNQTEKDEAKAAFRKKMKDFWKGTE